MEIEVIYEKGVFRPLQKVDLKEGTRGWVSFQEKNIMGLLAKTKGNLKVPSSVLESIENELYERH